MEPMVTDYLELVMNASKPVLSVTKLAMLIILLATLTVPSVKNHYTYTITPVLIPAHQDIT
jgi:hypothetical protein